MLGFLADNSLILSSFVAISSPIPEYSECVPWAGPNCVRVLPYIGIARYLRYYDGIRLPRRRLASSVCCVVGHTPMSGGQRGSPELPNTHCTSCLALRLRGDSPTQAISAQGNVVFQDEQPVDSHQIYSNFGAQSLSGLMPNCQRLKHRITALSP